MSYAGGTTHYSFPQIASSDRPTFADFNEAFRTLDTKLYGLEGDASTTDGRLDTLEDKMGTAEDDITNLKSADIRIEGKADANAEAITLLQGTVGTHTTQIATKADMVAIGDVYLTTQGYTEGDVVMYNGQRYVCTTTYTTGEPFDADKWTAVDVNTELAQINSALNEKSLKLISKAVTGTTAANGILVTGISVLTYTCIGASTEDGNAVPWRGSDNNWFVRVTDDNGTPVSTTSVTVYLYLIENTNIRVNPF